MSAFHVPKMTMDAPTTRLHQLFASAIGSDNGWDFDPALFRQAMELGAAGAGDTAVAIANLPTDNFWNGLTLPALIDLSLREERSAIDNHLSAMLHDLCVGEAEAVGLYIEQSAHWRLPAWFHPILDACRGRYTDPWYTNATAARRWTAASKETRHCAGTGEWLLLHSLDLWRQVPVYHIMMTEWVSTMSALRTEEWRHTGKSAGDAASLPREQQHRVGAFIALTYKQGRPPIVRSRGC